MEIRKTAECKLCKKDYEKEKVKRINGRYSSVYLQGFCSARCYTDNLIQNESSGA